MRQAAKAAALSDVDGNSYIDFNLADLSNTVGYGHSAISRRLAAQAEKGLQYLLPGEDAIAVAEELKRRTGMPKWQFTISASSANTEVIRIARAFTGREKIVLFEGKYHGHIDATMAEGGAPGGNAPAVPEAMGVSARATADTVNVPFNDAEALARALTANDVALVMAEPALTNCGLVLPEPGFLNEACRLAREAGALFALDETHTWQLAFGGFVRAEGLACDFVGLGKGLGSGAPLGAYGMSEAMGAFLERHCDDYVGPVRGLAIGGTTFASAITMAAARAMLEEVATEDGLQAHRGAGQAPGRRDRCHHLPPRSRWPRLPLRAALRLLPHAGVAAQPRRGPALARQDLCRCAAHVHGQSRHLGSDRKRRPAGLLRPHRGRHRPLSRRGRRVRVRGLRLKLALQHLDHAGDLIAFKPPVAEQEVRDVAAGILSHQPAVADDEFAAREDHRPVVADEAFLAKQPS